MKHTSKSRIMALILSVLMVVSLVPAFVISTVADGYTTDFDSLTAQTYGDFSNYALRHPYQTEKYGPVYYSEGPAPKPNTWDPGEWNVPLNRTPATNPDTSIFQSVTPTFTVVDKGNGDKYVKVPYEGFCTYHTGGWPEVGNVDARLRMNTPSYSYQTTDVLSIQMDYSYNNEVLGINNDYREAECQFYEVQTGGASKWYATLFRLCLKNGALSCCGTKVDGVISALLPNTWYTIRIVLDLKSATYTLYVDDVKSFENGSLGSSNDTNPGYSNITIPQGSLTPIMLIRQTSLYTENAQSFVAIDNVSYGPYVEVPEAHITTLAGASLRLGLPTGIRFETTIAKADVESLQAKVTSGEIKSFALGTMIAPTDYVNTVGKFTKEAFDKAEAEYVTVPATVGAWFAEDTTTYTFAGSLSNIQKANYNRFFSGVGYIDITMPDDTVYTYYGGYDVSKHSRSISYIAYKAKCDTAYYGTLSDLLKGLLDNYVEAFDGPTGLNVLAIGDSLFGGHTLGTEGQWLTLIGNDYDWNFTNCGKNGYTIAYDTTVTERGSLYNEVVLKNSYKFEGDANSVDIVFLEGGFNDRGDGLPAGEPSDTVCTTFCGAWNLMTDYLLATYPNAHIVFVTPWEITSTKDYIDNIKSVYTANYSTNPRVALLDAGDPAVSGINMNDATYNGVESTLTTYSIWRDTYWDPYHLNEDGMAHMKSTMTPLIRDLVLSWAD